MTAWKQSLQFLLRTASVATSAQNGAQTRLYARCAIFLFLMLALNIDFVSMAQKVPAKPADDFAAASMLAQQGRAAEAKTATLKALEHHPSSVEGYNLL